MAYQKIPFTPDYGGVTADDMNHIQTQYDAVMADAASLARVTEPSGWSMGEADLWVARSAAASSYWVWM